jgi:hypothetical protein
VALGSRTEGRSEDATVQRCAAAGNNRSWTTSGLTQGGRQSVGLVGSDTIVKIKQGAKIEWAEKERFFGPKQYCEEEFGMLQFK